MFPLIPILAWTGGIAASAQVAGGLVRGAGHLVRGRPGSALLQVADGCVAPLKTACVSLSELGHDVYQAVLGPWRNPLAEPVVIVTPPPRKTQRREAESELCDAINGLSAAS